MTDNHRSIEFNLHNLVTIRVVDGGPADVAAVRRQVGLPAMPVQESGPAPDITIRFVDRLDTPGLRYIGVDDAAFTNDAFFVLRGKNKRLIKVQIPFAEIGTPTTLVSERNVGAIPLLTAITNLTALAKGALPLHAAAFCYGGHGVLTTGWSKGGKTETLLGFMAHGATFIGDEWVYLSPDGARMYGLPEPVRIWEWHLSEMPEYRARLSPKQRARMALLRAPIALADRAAERDGNSLLRRARPLLRRQHGLNISPQRLFGHDRLLSSGPLDKVFFVVSGEAPEVTVEPGDPEVVAARMLFSLLEEQMPLLSYYWKYRFAFPERPNELLETVQQRQAEALQRVLAGKELYIVTHPYPAPIPAMVAAMAPVLA